MAVKSECFAYYFISSVVPVELINRLVENVMTADVTWVRNVFQVGRSD